MYCPRCGKEIDEDAVYCTKCGYKLSQKNAEVEQRFCLKCGAELKKGESFCSSCGTRIDEIGPEKATEVKYPHQVATILGYVFAFLGGLIGIGLGIYLLTRVHPRAKYHGKIILIIAIVMTIIWIIARANLYY